MIDSTLTCEKAGVTPLPRVIVSLHRDGCGGKCGTGDGNRTHRLLKKQGYQFHSFQRLPRSAYHYATATGSRYSLNSYSDPSPKRYAGSHYLILIYTSEYMNHYFPTNLEPRHGLWWPTCLVLCSAALWHAALKPLRCLCKVQYSA